MHFKHDTLPKVAAEKQTPTGDRAEKDLSTGLNHLSAGFQQQRLYGKSPEVGPKTADSAESGCQTDPKPGQTRAYIYCSQKLPLVTIHQEGGIQDLQGLPTTGPLYLSNLAPHYLLSRALPSKSRMLIASCRDRLVSAGGKIFKSKRSKLWDQLPLEIRKSNTLLTFRKHVKTWLFDR